jgi:hypothetical protein
VHGKLMRLAEERAMLAERELQRQTAAVADLQAQLAARATANDAKYVASCLFD